ncbi:MAG: hypothetical protein OQK11_01785 [Thiovulaceae bacterium]|nr:hypothetical protein [Sulfurimonadaceae bacterium]
MTKNELKLYNGKDGAKAYVAFKGKVYDVTDSLMWKNGEHQGMHNAGLDLTSMMSNAPHSDEVFDDFNIVATLEEDKKNSNKVYQEKLRIWYKKYHPHPMVVHFPIVLHIYASLFDLLFLFTFKENYAIVIYYTFLAATIMGLLAMLPGLLSWWVNYSLSNKKPFIIKIVVSVITLLLGLVAIAIYINNPNIVFSSSFLGIIYHFIILVTGINVIILGYYGGKITWGNNS